MHHLVAADAKNAHAEDFPALGIHQHLHEALRLAALARAADRAHRKGGDQGLAAGLAHLGLGHSSAAEGRIDEEAIGGDAIAHPSVLAVEEISSHDLIVIVGSVGEGAAAIAVADRPDAGHIGAQLFVHLDITTLVGGHARRL